MERLASCNLEPVKDLLKVFFRLRKKGKLCFIIDQQ